MFASATLPTLDHTKRDRLVLQLRLALHIFRLARLGYRDTRPPALRPAQQLALPENDLALQRSFCPGQVRARAAARGSVVRSGDHWAHILTRPRWTDRPWAAPLTAGRTAP